jgi:hypothetical protein
VSAASGSGTARALNTPSAKTAFGPAAIDAMSKAFEEACIALQVYAGDEKGREIIATRIVDLARNGLIDPTALRDRVIAEARLSE